MTDAISQGVRDGRQAPVTCSACGCRLEAIGRPGAQAWFHYAGDRAHDARGCSVDCVTVAHDARGRATVAAA